MTRASFQSSIGPAYLTQTFDRELLYSNRGVALHAQGDYAKAIADHKKALDLNPELPDAYYNLGVAYKSIRSVHEALEAYRKFIQYAQSDLSKFAPSPPYTFFLLNGDRKLNRNGQLFI